MQTPLATLTLTPTGTFSFMHRGFAITIPTHSECGRFIYSPEDKASEHILRDYGFEIVGTGGGCTAWQRDFVLEDGTKVYMMVTDGNCGHEATPGDTVVGVYPADECGEALAWWLA